LLWYFSLCAFKQSTALPLKTTENLKITASDYRNSAHVLKEHRDTFSTYADITLLATIGCD
jgi:hypothetical protein